jgi:hypothetical protein
MIEIRGTCSADVMCELVEEHLNDFGLDACSDIVAATGDGAAVMIAFGERMTFEFMICLNHTIHLAVLEIVFPKKTHVEIDSDDEEDCMGEVFFPDDDYKSSIDRMVKITKFFKKSPTRSHILKEHQKKKGMKILELKLFTKTRWNSLVDSAQRFLELLPSILEVLREEYNSFLPWDDSDTNKLEVSFNHVSICTFLIKT